MKNEGQLKHMSIANVSLILTDKEKDKEIKRPRRSVEEKNLIDILTLLFDILRKIGVGVLEKKIKDLHKPFV